ncbi:MAG: lipid-binding SYLF domain-containing protein [Nitrospirota bacterium]
MGYNQPMRKGLFLVVLLALALAGCQRQALAPTALEKGREKEVLKVQDAVEVLDAMERIPEKSIPPALLGNARGVAVIPGVIKLGYVLGGRHGTGVLLVRTAKGWSYPVFISLSGGSVGLQVGAQSADIVLVFKSTKGIDGILSGKFTLGADASVAAGPVGRQAEASTDAQLKAEIYSYARSRGLFAGVSVEGSVLRVDGGADADFYRAPGVGARDIFSGRDVGRAHPVAEKLRATLKKYTTE